MRGGAFFNGKEGRDDFRKTAPSRAVTSLALLERARAWEWVKDPPAGVSVPYKGNRKGRKDY